MSGKRSKNGLPVFTVTGSDTQVALARRATRRQRINAMLIAYRQRVWLRDAGPKSAPLEQWLAWQCWNLAWECALLNYRDGNNEGTKAP